MTKFSPGSSLGVKKGKRDNMIQIVVLPKPQPKVEQKKPDQFVTIAPRPTGTSLLELGIQPVMVKNEKAVSLLDADQLALLKSKASSIKVETVTSSNENGNSLPTLETVTSIPENYKVSLNKGGAYKQQTPSKTVPNKAKRKMKQGTVKDKK